MLTGQLKIPSDPMTMYITSAAFPIIMATGQKPLNRIIKSKQKTKKVTVPKTRTSFWIKLIVSSTIIAGPAR